MASFLFLLIMWLFCKIIPLKNVVYQQHTHGTWGNGFIPITQYGSEFGKKLRNGKQRAPVRLLFSGRNHYDLLVWQCRIYSSFLETCNALSYFFLLLIELTFTGVSASVLTFTGVSSVGRSPQNNLNKSLSVMWNEHDESDIISVYIINTWEEWFCNHSYICQQCEKNGFTCGSVSFEENLNSLLFHICPHLYLQ